MGSPLYHEASFMKGPAMPDTNSYVEKRIYPRVQVNLPVKYRVFEDEMDLTTVLERKKDN